MKTIIITGGATGIGKAICEELASKNYNLIINYNNSKKEAIELKEKLKEINNNIEIFKADLTKRENIKKLVEFTINKFKNIDVLINNAGIDLIKVFNDITDEEFYHVIDTNLYSAFVLTQEVTKYMISKKQGLIINISSIWGQVGSSCESLYSLTKAGLDNLTKSLAKELGPSNIRVNSIAPGIIDTKMNEHLSIEEKNEILNEIPLGRMGKSEEIAKCIKWLIEDNYTTGQIIRNKWWMELKNKKKTMRSFFILLQFVFFFYNYLIKFLVQILLIYIQLNELFYSTYMFFLIYVVYLKLIRHFLQQLNL